MCVTVGVSGLTVASPTTPLPTRELLSGLLHTFVCELLRVVMNMRSMIQYHTTMRGLTHPADIAQGEAAKQREKVREAQRVAALYQRLTSQTRTK